MDFKQKKLEMEEEEEMYGMMYDMMFSTTSINSINLKPVITETEEEFEIFVEDIWRKI